MLLTHCYVRSSDRMPYAMMIGWSIPTLGSSCSACSIKLTYAAACERGAEEAEEQAELGDRANWIKSEAALPFPEAVTILDWMHLWLLERL